MWCLIGLQEKEPKNAGPKMVKLIKRLIAAESTSMKPSEQTARISVMGQATVACTI